MRGSNLSDLTEKTVVLWIGGRLKVLLYVHCNLFL